MSSGTCLCIRPGTASLAAQAHADVIHPATGRPIPTSLFLVNVAESGERKSAADRDALDAVRKHEEADAEKYKIEKVSHRDAMEAQETVCAMVKKKTKGGRHSVKMELQALGKEPKPPRKPCLLVEEPTYEGLTRLYAEGQPHLGLFSAEGGGFLGG